MKIAVIGAGAAGLMAAYSAAKEGGEVTVYEKNEKAGKKIYITGKGRCNVTNNCDRDEFFSNIMRNPKFMYKSFAAFNNMDLMELIESFGTPLKVERGGRVFPVSDHASDITKALVKACESVDVKFKFNSRVLKLITDFDKDERFIRGLRTNEGDFTFDSVILACGGATYPGAGGCRYGYDFAKSLDLQVTDICPSLVPFLLKEDYIKELQGLALKNVTLTIRDENKIIFKEFGEMLFTHFGISGPIVLTASAKIGDVANCGNDLFCSVDLKPAIPDKELDARLIDILEKNPKKEYKSFYKGLVPQSLQEVLVRLSGIEPDRLFCDIGKNDRKKIFKLLRELPMTIIGLRGFNEAIITRGGVSVKEIDPKTMAVKKVRGLFMAGEMLDIDALTGGFNLQCAFSMGYVAGVGAVNHLCLRKG